MTMVLKRPNESESQPAENRPNAEPLEGVLGGIKADNQAVENQLPVENRQYIEARLRIKALLKGIF
jgi:hypothetical protein